MKFIYTLVLSIFAIGLITPNAMAQSSETLSFLGTYSVISDSEHDSGYENEACSREADEFSSLCEKVTILVEAGNVVAYLGDEDSIGTHDPIPMWSNTSSIVGSNDASNDWEGWLVQGDNKIEEIEIRAKNVNMETGEFKLSMTYFVTILGETYTIKLLKR